MTSRSWLLAIFVVPLLPRDALGVTEEDFLKNVNGTHPAFAETQEEVAIAEADLARVRAWQNIAIGLEQESPDGGPKQTTISVDWVFPFDGRRGLLSHAGEVRTRGANQERLAASLQLRSEARGAYARWALAQVRQRSSDSLLARVERFADQSTARADRGEESGLSARRLQLAVLEVRAASARATAEMSNAHALAKAWVPELPKDAEPERPELPVAPVGPLLPANPTLEARRLEVERFELEARVARRFWEAPQFSFGWQRIEDDEQSVDGPVFGVSWSLPLFDRRQADRIQAHGQLAAARARLELAERQTQAEIEGVLAAYVHLREAALEADRLVSESDQIIEAAAARVRLGESDLTDLLETLRTVLAARGTALDLYSEALEAHRALELAVGRPLVASEESR